MTADIARVADIVDEFTIVINKGSSDGVMLDQRFLIYGIGKDIMDPVTQKSLGPLEIVKGTGRVTHVQERISTIRSTMTRRIPGQTIRTTRKGGLGLLTLGPEEVTETKGEGITTVQFENAQVGDYAKKI